ncbi:hypothetical protein AB0958_19010 [Streptomyces sp. NPDC006655]|uniref:hypothetical protein n=1 Tax=Streptomyces sp. NPDC006655 TaxID=3156898 RepID=UPI0034533287
MTEPTTPQAFTDAVAALVAQLGEQHLPALDGTPDAQQFNREQYAIYARSYGRVNARNYDPDPNIHSDWSTVLLGAVYDVVREADPTQQRNRLITLAALTQAWADDIDRTTPDPEEH